MLTKSNEKQKVLVVGLGEIGRPLLELISKRHDAIGVDVEPVVGDIQSPDVLHICYPFEIADFIGETAHYIRLFKPRLTVINSTVSIGTTRAVAERTGAAVVHSPVRGKHARMIGEMQSYTKFVGAMDGEAGRQAREHFESLGLKVKVLSAPEATELAKLTETTYFGLLIAWAQEIERYCDRLGQSYPEVASFFEEIQYLPPVKYFPGVIGGHCVMPNIEILSKFDHSAILKAIQVSNISKIERETRLREAATVVTPVSVVTK